MSNETKPICPECDEKEQIVKNGFSTNVNTLWKQKYKCKMCWNNFTSETVTETERTPEIAPETAKTDEQVSEEMKNPKYEAFKANYNNKFPEPKESKKYWFTFSSWSEYYSERAKVIPKKKKETVETPVENTEVE